MPMAIYSAMKIFNDIRSSETMAAVEDSTVKRGVWLRGLITAKCGIKRRIGSAWLA